ALENVASPRSDEQFDAFACQCHAARLAESLARRADDRLAAFYSQVHCLPLQPAPLGAVSSSAASCPRAWSPTCRNLSAQSRTAAACAALLPRLRAHPPSTRRSSRRPLEIKEARAGGRMTAWTEHDRDA